MERKVGITDEKSRSRPRHFRSQVEYYYVAKSLAAILFVLIFASLFLCVCVFRLGCRVYEC